MSHLAQMGWEGFTEKQGRRDLSAWTAAVDENEISQGWSQQEGRSSGIRERNSWKHQDSRVSAGSWRRSSESGRESGKRMECQ